MIAQFHEYTNNELYIYFRLFIYVWLLWVFVRASLIVQLAKKSPAVETPVQFLGQEDLLEKG